MITAIVLAAGTSSRMGRPKQLILYQGRPLLHHVIHTLMQSKVDKIVVVLGHRHAELAALLEGLPIEMVINQDYALGQSTSIKAGLKALSPSSFSPVEGTSRPGVLFVLGDQPLLRPKTINLLIDGFKDCGGIVAPFYQGVRGNPILFDLSFKAELETLQGDIGARQIISSHPEALTKIQVSDPGILLDVDTPDDLKMLQTRKPNLLNFNK